MRRTEMCFRRMNDRILRLEQKQLAQGPTDEQVERVRALDPRLVVVAEVGQQDAIERHRGDMGC